MKYKILIISFIFILIKSIAIADESSLQKQLDKQQEIIDAQSIRIELEVFIKEFKNKLSDNNSLEILLGK